MWSLYGMGTVRDLEKAARDRPVARAILADRQERKMDKALRASYTLARIRDEVAWLLESPDSSHIILPPCTWCGELTGGYCDPHWLSKCSLGEGGMCAAVCSECDEEHSESCRQHFIWKLLEPIPATSAESTARQG